jgi:hypothetical protein
MRNVKRIATSVMLAAIAFSCIASCKNAYAYNGPAFYCTGDWNLVYGPGGFGSSDPFPTYAGPVEMDVLGTGIGATATANPDYSCELVWVGIDQGSISACDIEECSVAMSGATGTGASGTASDAWGDSPTGGTTTSPPGGAWVSGTYIYSGGIIIPTSCVEYDDVSFGSYFGHGMYAHASITSSGTAYAKAVFTFDLAPGGGGCY